MDNMQRFNDLTKPLLDLGGILGIEPEKWVEQEELEQITYNTDKLNQVAIKKVELNHILSLKVMYGDAISGSFRLEDILLLDFSEDIDETSFSEFQSCIEDIKDLTFHLKLNKQKLIGSLIESNPNCNIFLYLFSGALEQFFSNSLNRLESFLWNSGADSNKRVIFIVPAREIILDGLYLNVVGGTQLSHLDEIISKPIGNAEHLREMYHICQNNVNWQIPWLRHLTPLHFEVQYNTYPSDLIAKLLLIHQFNSIILYTASKTTGNSKKPVISTYTGVNQTIDVKLENDVSFIVTDDFVNIQYLIKILKWAYNSDWVDDRITFIQIVIGQSLNNASPFDRYQLLLRNSQVIFENLKWHWSAFIEKKVDNYVHQVQELEDYITNIVQAFSDQIASMVKNLTETMLAAVAVVIGSVIAAFSDTEFDPKIFAFGLTAYGIYVLFFPLIYNMLYQWGQYKSACENFEYRKKRYGEKLYPEKVEAIIGNQIENCKSRFKKWYVITVSVYIIVLLLSFLVSFLLIGVIKIPDNLL